jgi:TonB family protein
MSGRFLQLLPVYASGLLTRMAPGREARTERLLAALAFSGVLHAAVLIVPALGERLPEFRLAVSGADRSPYPLTATLVLRGAHRFSAAPLQAEGESVPRPSVSGRATSSAIRPEEAGSSRIGALPIRSQAYYTTDQLSRRPQPLAAAELDPEEIKPVVASGKVVLKLWISDAGSVAEVEVESSDLPAMFTRAAVAGFKRLRFTPGERDGRPVGTVIKIEVLYQDGRALPR